MKGQLGIWAAILGILFMGALWDMYPLPDAGERLESIPQQGLGFSGTDVPMSEVEKQVFEGCNLIKRYYSYQGQVFFLSVVDGTGNRNAVHDPTFCFTGGGWEIENRQMIAVRGGTAERIFLKKGEKSKEVLLWFSNGKKRYASPVRYWVDTTIRRLSLGWSGAEPVRVMLQPPPGEQVDWDKVLAEFYPLWEF